MHLIEFKDCLGRLSLKPKFETHMPLFKHITNGSISVTVEAWDDDHVFVAAMHDVFCITDMLEEAT